MNYLEGCNDSSNMCKTWIKEAWFPEWCNGKHKSNTAKGYFGGMTLRETCQHSCGGCPAVDANTETNRRENSTTEYSGLDGLRGRTTVIDENTSTQQLVLTTLTPILTTEVSGRKALEFFNIIMHYIFKNTILWYKSSFDITAPKKVLGEWKNSGQCKSIGKNPTCGSGLQTQTRNCTDGTLEKCTKQDSERQISCFIAGTALPECKSKF